MGRARFLLCTGFIIFIFRRFVGDQIQTSLGYTSNDATYDVYSSKAVNVLKIYEYSTLYFVQNILPFCVIEELDSKQMLNA